MENILLLADIRNVWSVFTQTVNRRFLNPTFSPSLVSVKYEVNWNRKPLTCPLSWYRLPHWAVVPIFLSLSPTPPPRPFFPFCYQRTPRSFLVAVISLIGFHSSSASATWPQHGPLEQPVPTFTARLLFASELRQECAACSCWFLPRLLDFWSVRTALWVLRRPSVKTSGQPWVLCDSKLDESF